MRGCVVARRSSRRVRARPLAALHVLSALPADCQHTPVSPRHRVTPEQLPPRPGGAPPTQAHALPPARPGPIRPGTGSSRSDFCRHPCPAKVQGHPSATPAEAGRGPAYGGSCLAGCSPGHVPLRGGVVMERLLLSSGGVAARGPLRRGAGSTTQSNSRRGRPKIHLYCGPRGASRLPARPRASRGPGRSVGGWPWFPCARAWWLADWSAGSRSGRVPMRPRVWPGFSRRSVRCDSLAPGVRVWGPGHGKWPCAPVSVGLAWRRAGGDRVAFRGG